MKTVKAGRVVARALWGKEGAHLAGRHVQCFIGGARLSLQVLAYPGAPRGTRPLYGSSRQSPFSRERSAWWATVGTTRDPQMTGCQAVRTRSVDCSLAPAATYVDQF